MPRPRRSMAVIAVLAATVLVAACGGRGDPPPSPTATLDPVVIALLVKADHDPTNRRVTLDDGMTLSIGDQASTMLTTGSGVLTPGDLVLTGPGNPPAWWAALPSKNRVPPSGSTKAPDVPDGLCWRATGGAFDEETAIHFSNGLRLMKTADFHVVYAWIPDPFPTRTGDSFCVNRQGQVITLDFIWEPY